MQKKEGKKRDNYPAANRRCKKGLVRSRGGCASKGNGVRIEEKKSTVKSDIRTPLSGARKGEIPLRMH